MTSQRKNGVEKLKGNNTWDSNVVHCFILVVICLMKSIHFPSISEYNFAEIERCYTTQKQHLGFQRSSTVDSEYNLLRSNDVAKSEGEQHLGFQRGPQYLLDYYAILAG
jgi:hypothetical protein